MSLVFVRRREDDDKEEGVKDEENDLWYRIGVNGR